MGSDHLSHSSSDRQEKHSSKKKDQCSRAIESLNHQALVVYCLDLYSINVCLLVISVLSFHLSLEIVTARVKTWLLEEVIENIQ